MIQILVCFDTTGFMQFAHFCLLFRNQAVGTCSLVARIGGIVSLLLNLLKVRNLVAWSFTKDKFKLDKHLADE